MATQVYLNNFRSGELSPHMAGAVDTARYLHGCRTLRNMIARSVAGADKRPGTYVIGRTKGDHDAILIPFIDSASARWMLELSADADSSTFRFWSVLSRTVDGGADPDEVAGPWKQAELREIKAAANRGILSLAHKGHPLENLAGTAGAWSALSSPSYIGAEYSVTIDTDADTMCALNASRLTEGCAVTLRASSAGSLPAPLATGTTYYVKDISRTKRLYTDEEEATFALAETVGGATIDLTTTGSGVVYVRVQGLLPFQSPGQYPQAVAYFLGRQYLVIPPNEIWASRTFDAAAAVDRFDDFTVGTAADAALHIKENDMAGSLLHWICSHAVLAAGSEYAEWATSGDVPTPSTFDLVQAASYGAADVQPDTIDSGVVYVRAGGRTIAMLVPSSTGKYRSIDIMDAADHLGVSGFRQIACQSIPEPVIWAVAGDGSLVSGTYNTSDGTVGWAQHHMGGGGIVESIAVTRGAIEDELWLVVRRGDARTIEVMAPRLQPTLQELHYVDAGLYLEPASATVSGLSHLEGLEVEAWSNCGVLPAKTVVEGAVTYDRTVAWIHIGLAIDSELSPRRILHNGRLGKISRTLVRVYRSLGGKVGRDIEHTSALIKKIAGSRNWGDTPELVSGDLAQDFPGLVDDMGCLSIFHTDPTPLSVLAIIADVEPMEK